MNINSYAMRSVAASCILSVLFCSACIRIARIPRETDLGSHHVSVTPDCQSASTHSNRRSEKDGSSRIEFYEFKCADTTILIRDNTLNVNGKSYGTLNENDIVAVTYGKVSVNSTLRSADR